MKQRFHGNRENRAPIGSPPTFPPLFSLLTFALKALIIIAEKYGGTIMGMQIRQGVFETNSSSTHSITLCLKSDWEDFINGKTMVGSGGEVLVAFGKYGQEF